MLLYVATLACSGPGHNSWCKTMITWIPHEGTKLINYGLVLVGCSYSKSLWPQTITATWNPIDYGSYPFYSFPITPYQLYIIHITSWDNTTYHSIVVQMSMLIIRTMELTIFDLYKFIITCNSMFILYHHVPKNMFIMYQIYGSSCKHTIYHVLELYTMYYVYHLLMCHKQVTIYRVWFRCDHVISPMGQVICRVRTSIKFND